MNISVRFLSGAISLLLLVNSTAYAWNGHGHMMVAAIAYQKLTPAKKNRVNALLQLNPDWDNWNDLIPAGTSASRRKMMLFMLAATWADRIKSDPDYHTDGTHNGNRPPTDGTADRNIGYDDLARHKYWHFIDTPFTIDATPLPPIITPNAKDRVAAFRAVLASSSPDALKSYDLSWLLHLVGDLHQPLHCLARVSAHLPEGDDGGNGVKLTSPSNLHTFWDSAAGTGNAPSTALNAIASLPNAPAAAANDLDVAHWIDEAIAVKGTVYKNPPIGTTADIFTLTTSYKNAARTLARKQVALAGARLAKILNDELN